MFKFIIYIFIFSVINGQCVFAQEQSKSIEELIKSKQQEFVKLSEEFDKLAQKKLKIEFEKQKSAQFPWQQVISLGAGLLASALVLKKFPNLNAFQQMLAGGGAAIAAGTAVDAAADYYMTHIKEVAKDDEIKLKITGIEKVQKDIQDLQKKLAETTKNIGQVGVLVQEPTSAQ